MATQRELVKELFGFALDLLPAERAAFLDSACNGDPELRREVEILLAAHAEAGSFLEQPVFQGLTADMVSRPKSVIGPYQFLELIGEGGMGEVWLAEQKRPVRRRVAIKLIKVGMDTREVVARFESERQALALMDHPAIAKVFDAGTTAEGRPYFVMEYVAGVPITTFCDKHKLTIRERMELFIQVCEGVQHAHQKAIIHRDLKPSNILVSEIDGKPMPRIIDFGVAKAISQKLTADTLHTRVGMLIGTVGYMSPEQADPLGDDIDTRTDIYSLGVVLYELLAGRLPLDFKKLAYDEVLRVLREVDAPRPSTTVNTLRGESAVAARNRSSDPPTLIRQLRGDPDAIALKALEKDRSRRYASASGLAADIGRYLRNEPVIAHPPSAAYRMRKYLRRHRLGVAMAAISVLLLMLLFAWSRTPAAIPTVESVTQLTDDGQAKGDMVTDGSRIYFERGEPEGRKIAQVPVIGGPTAPLETAFANTWLRGIARDGSSLLVSVPADNDPISLLATPLWLIPLPSGEPRRIGDLDSNGYADMLPDGRIVFARYVSGVSAGQTDGRSDWFIADKNGSDPRKLVSLAGRVGQVFVSPRSDRILLIQEQPGDRRLFEIAPDGASLREIRKLGADEHNFIWGSNEKYLIYSSQTASQSDIWILRLPQRPFRHTGRPIRLTNGPLPYSNPCSSRDGKQIFVLAGKQRGELVRYDMKSHQFLPFLSGISATDPSFSRDGNWVAYDSYPDHTLWRSRSNGSERKQLTFSPMDVRFPSISPEGKRVSFHDGKGELFVISVAGGTPQKIGDNSTYASWSPDGNRLRYHFYTPATGGLEMIFDLRTGEKSILPASQDSTSGYWLTRDLLVSRNARETDFLTFNLKTGRWIDLTPGGLGKIEHWAPSPTVSISTSQPAAQSPW
jgi:serine/threonine protein kinase